MKQITRNSLLMLIVAISFSFTYFGGEGFEISLNNKVIIQQFGEEINKAQRIKLTPHSANDQLTVRYHHCGKISKDRVITFKNDQGKIVKTLRFADVNKPLAAMSCNVKDILDLGSKNETVLNMYYTSSELPAGRMLANILVENYTLAKK